MNRNTLNMIVGQVNSFPALPSIVSNIIEITGNPESSAEDLMQAMLPDQSICVTIMKIANSAFFGLPRQVNTIEKAVMVLGFDEIRNIILGKAVFNSFEDLGQSNRETIERFWNHTFTCGLAAKIIAEDLKLSPSEYFITGLIHDIGKLAILMSLNGDYKSIFEASGLAQIRSYIQEQEYFSISHDEVGSRLLNRWLFPKSIINAIKYHHMPQDSEEPLKPSIIQVADFLAHNHLSSEQINPQETMDFISDFMPETKSLWEEQGLDWNNDLFVNWREKLTQSSEKDQAILTIITS